MKIGLCGDESRRIAVSGSGFVPEGIPRWHSMGLNAYTKLILDTLLDEGEEQEEEPQDEPSSLCQRLFPVLMNRKDTLVISDPNEVSKKTYLLYASHLLSNKKLNVNNSFPVIGPMCIIVVPNPKLVHKIDLFFKKFQAELHVFKLVEDDEDREILSRTHDLIVGTPDAVRKFFERYYNKNLKLVKSTLQLLIIDKLDECVNAEFSPDIDKILFLLAPIPTRNPHPPPPHPQIVVFSGSWIMGNAITRISKHFSTDYITLRCREKFDSKGVGAEGEGVAPQAEGEEAHRADPDVEPGGGGGGAAAALAAAHVQEGTPAHDARYPDPDHPDLGQR